MITFEEIESAYKNLREREEDLYEATEEEIQARIYFDSLRSIEQQFRKPDFYEEKMKRVKILEDAERNKRRAIHLHRLAKTEIQKNKDLLDCWQLNHMPDEYTEGDVYNVAEMEIKNRKLRT